MPRQVITRVLLVCAVLFAQQTALAHDFWHATAQKTTPAKGDKLCDLHDLLGTVLGVASGSPVTQETPVLERTSFQSIPAAWADNRPLNAQSRGPPPVS